jgi:hypothetical protein
MFYRFYKQQRQLLAIFLWLSLMLLFVSVNAVALRPEQLPTIQQVKLLASDRAASDNFGNAVAISADSSTAVIGAYLDDEGANTNNGAAYIFVRRGATWTQQAKLLASDPVSSDQFGNAVALSSDGNTVIVGAIYQGPGGSVYGAAYVYRRSGTTWTQQAKLQASDKVTGDAFGAAVALSANGLIALIGAPYKDDPGLTDDGAAYLFTSNGSVWTQQNKFQPANKAASDLFGISVALASDGTTALISATGKESTYVFAQNGPSWSQQAQLLASDGVMGDNFGGSVALAGDGNTALIGAWKKTNSMFTNAGAAYAFVRSGTTWMQQAKLLPATPAASDGFGISVALSGDSTTALIGASGQDTSPFTNNGAATLFTHSGTTWTRQNLLLASDRANLDQFGFSVTLSNSGNFALIGAPYVDSGGLTDNGAVYTFSDFTPTPTPTNTPIPRPDTIGIYRPSNQTFYLRNSNTTGGADITVQYGYLCGGNVCNYPIMGDWDGDGIDTIGIYDQVIGVFKLRNLNTPGPEFYFIVMGNPADQPLAGRWTNDMTHDGVGVFRPSNGILYLKKQLTSGVSDYFTVMGNAGDVGLAGDWNGDGFDSVGVYRPSQSQFYLTNNNQPSGITFSDLNFIYGDGAQDKPFVGDWTGNGFSKPGVFRSGTVMLRNTLNAGAPNTTFTFGAAGDVPLAGKWVAGSFPPNRVIVPPTALPTFSPFGVGYGAGD